MSHPVLEYNAWAAARAPSPTEAPEEKTSNTAPSFNADDDDDAVVDIQDPSEITQLLPTDPPTLRKRRTNNTALPWLHRKSGFYDDDHALDDKVVDGNGMRVWYDDYTTIDWIHDITKDRIRVRNMRNLKGWKGWLKSSYDAVQAWIIVSIIGVLCGTVAAVIEKSSNLLSDYRFGYCSRDWTLNKQFCCPNAYENSTSYLCDWKQWSTIILDTHEQFADSPITSSYWINYAAYVSIGILLATISASLVYLTSTKIPVIERPLRERRPTNTSSISVSAVIQPTLVVRYHAASSGIPELKTILSGFVVRGFLGIKTLLVKTIGLIFSVASGLMIGKQGPLLHISCCIGNIVSRLFEKYSRNEAKRREILSAASAAGVAVAFGAPIGGILFSLEEVSYYFPSKTMWRSFFCALIATVTIKVTYDKDWYAFELLPFLALGILGGLFGAAFINILTRLDRFKHRHSMIFKHPVGEVAVIATITGCLCWLIPFARITNSELVAYLFQECSAGDSRGGLCAQSEIINIVLLLLLCMVVKIALLFFTVGIIVPAGIFIPLMTIGACIGRIVGMVTLWLTQNYPDHPWFTHCTSGSDCVIPGVYAMVGSASFLCGVTRMTVSLVVIMFELTGALTYALPIMGSIMVSKWIGDWLCPDSIFDRQIASNNFPYLNHKKEFVHSKSVAQVMDVGGETLDIARRYSIQELEYKLQKVAAGHNSDGGFPLLEEDILAGYIAYTELEHVIDVAKEKQNQDYPCFFRRVNQSIPNHHFRNTRPESEQSGTDYFRNTRPESEQSGTDWSPNGIFTWEATDAATEPREPNDFTKWMDQAPLSVNANSSIEMVMELFVKLGVKTLFVVSDGRFVGTIHKKKLLNYLSSIK